MQQVRKAKDTDAPVVLEVRSLAKSFGLKQGLFGKREFKAVRNVSIKLKKVHTLGVVCEPGSGKTPMGLTQLRLNPRFPIGQLLVELLVSHGIGNDLAEREPRVRTLLDKEGLDGRAFGKCPHEFSSGQRQSQRMAIARCLTLNA